MSQDPPEAPKAAPRGTSGFIVRWLREKHSMPWGNDPHDYRPEAIEDLFLRWRRRGVFGKRGYFETVHRGMEHIPKGPVMVVSNHSGGTTMVDVVGFLEGWYIRFGLHRPLHPLAHEMIVSNPISGPWLSRHGILQANWSLAHDTLVKHRRDILVFPGGDLDTWRPYSKRYEVCFAGRTGYARLALKTGVHIIPVAQAGSHSTFYVLTDGRRIARAIGLPALARAEIFPVHLSLPWGLGIGPLPHIPIPTMLRYRVGPPVPPPEGAKPGEEPSQEHVRIYDQRVQAAVQRLLDELKEG